MRPKTPKVTRLDYCQYLLVHHINSTLTNFAEHREKFSHNALNRYLEREKLVPILTWENIQNQVVQTGKGFVVFDDTVADKDFSPKVELVRLMDSWYATQEIMLTLEKYEKSYFGLDRSRETARQNHHEQRLSTQAWTMS